MLLWRKPSAETTQAFLASQSKLDFTYPAVGNTAAATPSGYNVDHTRIRLGKGAEVFAAAKDALFRLQQFNLGWVEAWSPESPFRVGVPVAVVAHNLGLWWLNACRVVYVVNDTGPVERAGFAYGTLPDHAESGEERFMIEWNKSDGGVWYDILAFSRPRKLLIRLGYPWMRRMQKRFARDSAAAMAKAVTSSQTATES